jgi:hypothetical protein
MRPFLIKLVSVLLLTTLSVPILAEKSTEEARLIRKAFLDIRHVPPSPGELDWYLIYNTNSYQAAIQWLVSQTNTFYLKDYLLSKEYKQSAPVKLTQETLDSIIKYQCGNLNVTSEQADILLVKLAVVCGEDNITDTIDYIAVCLIARPTNVQEINMLMKIYKDQSTEVDGYLAVLKNLKTHKDFVLN